MTAPSRLLVLRHQDCGHLHAVSSTRSDLDGVKAEYEAAGVAGFRVQTVSSPKAAREALTEVTLGITCETCRIPEVS